MPWRKRIERTRAGHVRLRLPERERALLRGALRDLHGALDADADDPALRRLFPPAYEDAESEAEYRSLVRSDLVDSRRAAHEIVERTLDADRLADEEVHAWLGVLNDLRLVLGTRLDVDEGTFVGGIDHRDPQAQELALYAYLTWLQEQAVEAAGSAYS